MDVKQQIQHQIEEYKKRLELLNEHKDNETDAQIKALFDEEIEVIKKDIATLEESLSSIEGNSTKGGDKDSDEEGGVSKDKAVLEVRPGTGGDEAALFAGELFNMYRKFAEKSGWEVEILNMSEGNAGGVKLATAEIRGKNAYDLLKHESGVHRVQRIPITESGGRIHTSTATVAVLPVVTEVEVEIKPDELKWEFFRAGGHGGQNVNKVSTAVRLLHIPTGILVECQEERFQGKNREKALSMLRSKLYQEMRDQQVSTIAQLRAGQVGTGERVEKIRTYNFPQDRVTDHRIKKSWHNINSIMEGNIEEIVMSNYDN